MEISEEEYKLAKEAHVADCTGGSVHEVGIVCASLVVSLSLFIIYISTFILKNTRVLTCYGPH